MKLCSAISSSAALAAALLATGAVAQDLPDGFVEVLPDLPDGMLECLVTNQKGMLGDHMTTESGLDGIANSVMRGLQDTSTVMIKDTGCCDGDFASDRACTGMYTLSNIDYDGTMDDLLAMLVCIDEDTGSLKEETEGCGCSVVSDFMKWMASGTEAESDPMIEECCTAGVSNADFNKCMGVDDNSGGIAGLSAVAMLGFGIVGAVGLL